MCYNANPRIFTGGGAPPHYKREKCCYLGHAFFAVLFGGLAPAAAAALALAAAIALALAPNLAHALALALL